VKNVIMTGVWLNSTVKSVIMTHNKATVYFNPFIMTRNNPIAG
jgi:hypothetical protein